MGGVVSQDNNAVISPRLNKATHKFNQHPSILKEQALLYQKTNQTQEAIRCLKSILQKQPTDLETQYQLATLYLSSDQKQSQILYKKLLNRLYDFKTNKL